MIWMLCLSVCSSCVSIATYWHFLIQAKYSSIGVSRSQYLPLKFFFFCAHFWGNSNKNELCLVSLFWTDWKGRTAVCVDAKMLLRVKQQLRSPIVRPLDDVVDLQFLYCHQMLQGLDPFRKAGYYLTIISREEAHKGFCSTEPKRKWPWWVLRVPSAVILRRWRTSFSNDPHSLRTLA